MRLRLRFYKNWIQALYFFITLRYFGKEKPNNSWQRLTVSIVLVEKSFIKKSMNDKIETLQIWLV